MRRAVAAAGVALVSWVPLVQAANTAEAARLARLKEDVERNVERIRAERTSVKVSVDVLKRTMTGGDAAQLESVLRQAAQRAALADVAIERLAGPERLAFGDGRPAPVERLLVRVSARASYRAIARFLGQLARLARTVVLETLQLELGRGGGARTLTAEIALPRFLDLPEAGDTPPLVVKEAADVPREEDALRQWLASEEDALRRDRVLRDLLLRLHQQNDEPGYLLDSLAAFSRRARGLSAALRQARFRGGDSTLEGVLGDPSTPATVVAALEEAGLEVTGLRVRPGRGCHAFSVNVRARLPSPADRAGGEGNRLFVPTRPRWVREDDPFREAEDDPFALPAPEPCAEPPGRSERQPVPDAGPPAHPRADPAPEAARARRQAAVPTTNSLVGGASRGHRVS